MRYWYDDLFRYEGERGSWDDDRDDPNRGYLEQLQRSIDDPYLDTIDPTQEQQ